MTAPLLFLMLQLSCKLDSRRVIQACVHSSHLRLAWALFRGNSVYVDTGNKLFVEDLIRLKSTEQAKLDKNERVGRHLRRNQMKFPSLRMSVVVIVAAQLL